MSELDRRAFLAALASAAAGFRLSAQGTKAEDQIRVGYAAITWGGNDELAIKDIGDVGFKGIQLRASAFDKWGARPAELKALLAQHRVSFAVLSSGNLKYQPADREEQLKLHLSHAAFVRDAGGELLQVIDEKPRGRAVTPDDYARLADMLTALGERTRAIGVPLVYHHHMNSTGEPPAAIEAIMSNAAASSVGLLFDIAHYQQGGGDPVKAIRQYGKAITALHLKDVQAIDAAPGYQWVELGRGRVDVKGCVAALRDIGYKGWAIIELDRVVDPGGTPRASAIANRDYAKNQLRLTI